MTGVFALEGPWGNDLRDQSTIRPLLEMLEERKEIKFLHQDASTSAELKSLISEWTRHEYDRYQVCFFSFHGRRGKLEIGDDLVSLDDLGLILEGKCEGRIIHFDSCSVMRVPEPKLSEFKQRTGAIAVSGYSKTSTGSRQRHSQSPTSQP